MKWPKERIREELRKLDRKTGLSGSELPIILNRNSRYLGTFTHSPEGEPLYFTFSTKFCENDEFPEAQMINTIRHEYAHYMVCVRYPGLTERSHGRHWKLCCMEVGAAPLSSCDTRRDREIRKREKKKESESALIRALMPELPIGMQVTHPVFGPATISGVTPHADNPRISLTFPDGQKRLFPAKWIIEHCQF